MSFTGNKGAPKAREKMSPEELRSFISQKIEGKQFKFIVAFPEYQEGWEGFFYDDISENLHHTYYNPKDSVDVAIYDSSDKFIDDVIYLNSISLRNYPISFHLFSGSLDDFIKKVSEIEHSKIRNSNFGNGQGIYNHPDYFPVDELYSLC